MWFKADNNLSVIPSGLGWTQTLSLDLPGPVLHPYPMVQVRERHLGGPRDLIAPDPDYINIDATHFVILTQKVAHEDKHLLKHYVFTNVLFGEGLELADQHSTAGTII